MPAPWPMTWQARLLKYIALKSGLATATVTRGTEILGLYRTIREDGDPLKSLWSRRESKRRQWPRLACLRAPGIIITVSMGEQVFLDLAIALWNGLLAICNNLVTYHGPGPPDSARDCQAPQP